MKRTAVTFRIAVFLFILFSSIAGGQSKTPKDVEGWAKAKWGMSEQEILQVFGPDIRKLSKLGLDNVTVDKLHFDVQFVLDTTTNKLIGVRLTSIDKEVSTSSFWALEKALVEQYGTPTHRSNGTKLITAWEFKSTLIEMHYGESPLIGHYLLLNYSKSSK